MFRYLCPLFAVCGLAYGGGFAPATGDRIVWVGDSITHQCKYTQYVENFLYTRYHDKRLRTFSSGIKGDDAGDVLDRFDEDVAFFNPDWATILLGMNDGRYGAFDRDNFDLYQRDVGELLHRLKELGALAIVLSPSMFDHEQYDYRNREDDFRFKRINPHSEYNAKIAFFGGWLRRSAERNGLPFIDFWGAMNDATQQFRAANERFTLMPDSIHPNPSGMAIMAGKMAAYFTGERDYANRLDIAIDESGKGSVRVGEARLEAVDKDTLLAEVTPRHLPWVLPATGKMGPGPWYHVDDPAVGFAYALEGLGLNDDLLRVRGLEPGVYRVLMNGDWALEADSSELANGIALERHAASPAYRQSLELALLNAERNDLAMRPYRDAQERMKSVRRTHGDDLDRVREERAKLESELRRLFELAQAYEDRIHELAAPRSYRLEIKRAD